jgi:hypothetical protein
MSDGRSISFKIGSGATGATVSSSLVTIARARTWRSKPIFHPPEPCMQRRRVDVAYAVNEHRTREVIGVNVFRLTAATAGCAFYDFDREIGFWISGPWKVS